jgi:FG-GAP-like repeat
MKRLAWILLLSLANLPQAALAGQFKKPVYYNMGRHNNLPLSIVSADFNGDGNLDLAVADFGTGVIKILLGKGDGAFTFGKSFSVPSFVSDMAVGDFNGDHKLDLAVVEYGGTGLSGMAIFLGNGDGTFTYKTFYQLSVEALSAAVADFNGDGHLDIAVTNEGDSGNGNVMVFFGNGDGTFRTPTIYNLPSYPYSVAAADLNGDGYADLVVAQAGSVGSVTVLLNAGGGKFRKTGVYAVRGGPTNVAIADLNHDGIPDLAVATFEAVGVLLGKGGGKFGKAVLYSTKSISQEGNPYAVVVADFNGDGNPDIATVIDASSISGLFYGKGNGTFGPVVPIRLKSATSGDAITAGSYDKDRPLDLTITVSTGSQGGQAAVLLNAR